MDELYRIIKKLVNKWLNCGRKRSYLIHEQNGQYVLCKVINKYDKKSNAIHDMSEILTNKVTEFDIIKQRKD